MKQQRLTSETGVQPFLYAYNYQKRGRVYYSCEGDATLYKVLSLPHYWCLPTAP